MTHRLLFLTPFPPRLDARHGGGRTVASLLCHLGRRHHVALVCIRDENELGPDDAVRASCEVVEEVAWPRQPSSLLRQRLARLLKPIGSPPDRVTRTRTPTYAERARAAAESFRPDILQFECVEMTQYFDALDGVRAHHVVVDHDPGHSAAVDYSLEAAGLRRPSRYLDAMAWKRFSRTAFARADRIVVFTERDREALAGLAGATAVDVIPLAIELPPSALDPRGVFPPKVLFVGDYLHTPNSDAALRLTRTIMPRVRRAHPDAELELVGAHPTSAMATDPANGVAVRGVVPSVEPFLERAAVVVAPIRIGGGMRVKVLETLASGKALVASPRALEGLDVTDGEEVLVAEDDDAFVEAVSSLLADEERRVALAQRARRWAESALGWESSVAAYEALYRELLAGRE